MQTFSLFGTSSCFDSETDESIWNDVRGWAADDTAVAKIYLMLVRMLFACLGTDVYIEHFAYILVKIVDVLGFSQLHYGVLIVLHIIHNFGLLDAYSLMDLLEKNLDNFTIKKSSSMLF